MRVGIVGSTGQLGGDLARVFSGHEVLPWSRADFDVRDRSRTMELLSTAGPDVVINTAAFHNTVACEENPQEAFAVNAMGVRNLAEACEALGCVFVQISTDYVFDGEKGEAYVEEDVPRPINVYGVSKLAGELLAQAICGRYYVIRVASLFGARGRGSKGPNFIERVLGSAQRGEALRVVDDVTMSPTYTVDAARVVRAIVEASAPWGVYHITNSGECTWFRFALEILRQAGVEGKVLPTTLGALASKPRRPRNSALVSVRLPSIGIPPMPPWEEALARYLAEQRSRGKM